jgi:hypothetical protein
VLHLFSTKQMGVATFSLNLCIVSIYRSNAKKGTLGGLSLRCFSVGWLVMGFHQESGSLTICTQFDVAAEI